MTTGYILRGLDKAGKEFFFTGKAGQGWVSTDRATAFGYGKEGAVRKALIFNSNTDLHGIRFTAIPQAPTYICEACEAEVAEVFQIADPAGAEYGFCASCKQNMIEAHQADCDHANFTEAMDGTATCNDCGAAAWSCPDCGDMQPGTLPEGEQHICEACAKLHAEENGCRNADENCPGCFDCRANAEIPSVKSCLKSAATKKRIMPTKANKAVPANASIDQIIAAWRKL